MPRSFRLFILSCHFLALPLPAAEKVSFNRQIRPLLSDQCFACHGPDAAKRKGELRLDLRESAIVPAKSGERAIVPGDPTKSALIARIHTEDEEDHMPPAKTHKFLTPEQKELLSQWIAGGAEYEEHWAYLPPVKPAIPPDAGHPIDYLVHQRQQSLELQASPAADRRILMRRLYADLHGLPAPLAEVDAFANDSAPDAYEKVVDRLLDAPAYGERMAVWWLDLVRYADSAGYHSDKERNVSPFRDYIINSFNNNKPFDQLTIEHLAGDLLPQPTMEQKIGSCFNKLLLTTDEGGAQAKDYEARYLQDRVRAVGAVWLAQTWLCSQCHDHKYDPMLTKDFYSMGAFFADIDEGIIASPEPGIPVFTPEQQQEQDALIATRDRLKADAEADTSANQIAYLRWENAQLQAAIYPSRTFLIFPQGNPADGPTLSKKRKNSVEAALPADLTALLVKPMSQRTRDEQKSLVTYHRSIAPEWADNRRQLAETNAKLKDLEAHAVRCIVTRSTPNKRMVRILPRGDFMSESGPVVKAALPGYLPKPVIEGREPNRLDLAQWLISRENPLTARVLVNRLWKLFHGVGLSKPLEDFGLQGEMPPNAPLMDYLALEMMEQKWNIKAMVRLMVTSQTYRQTSVATPEMLSRDPENRELTRQGRHRLDAEFVRDFALATSGLLVRKIGGPSVRPYQPEGYWENLNFPTRSWDASVGEGQYRRGLYTWWQRMFLHPSMLAFDAATREECSAERTQSNIPQQALALLNDPSFVEAARHLALRAMTEATGDDAARLTWLWRVALQRAPAPSEQAAGLSLLAKHRADFELDVAAAREFGKQGRPVPDGTDTAELAAWSSVARVILNLHEFITRS